MRPQLRKGISGPPRPRPLRDSRPGGEGGNRTVAATRQLLAASLTLSAVLVAFVALALQS